MKKTLSIALSILLVLTLCLSLAACGEKSDSKAKDNAEQATEAPEPGIAVGDTFDFGGGKLTLTEIEEGATGSFDTAEEASGKYVSLHFDIGEDVGDFTIDSEPFTLNGSKGIDAIGKMVTKDDGKLGMDLVILFDIDKDADLEHLHLEVQ